MLCCAMLYYFIVCYVMLCYIMVYFVMLCYVMLCCVVLCYEPSAQTFYMSLEGLVGCMNEHSGRFTYFRLMERFYEMLLSTFGPRTCLKNVNALRSILKRNQRNFNTKIKQRLKQYVKEFEAPNFEALLKQS